MICNQQFSSHDDTNNWTSPTECGGPKFGHGYDVPHYTMLYLLTYLLVYLRTRLLTYFLVYLLLIYSVAE